MEGEMEKKIDTGNWCMVTATGSRVYIGRPPRYLDPGEARLLAAWLVVMADTADPSCAGPDIHTLIEAVEST
jgi:hypothetical protein